MLFDCDVQDRDVIDMAVLDGEELAEVKWASLDEAAVLLGDRVSRRLRAVASLLGTGSGVYLEDQAPI